MCAGLCSSLRGSALMVDWVVNHGARLRPGQGPRGPQWRPSLGRGPKEAAAGEPQLCGDAGLRLMHLWWGVC